MLIFRSTSIAIAVAITVLPRASLAAPPPPTPTPPEISIFKEHGRYEMRTSAENGPIYTFDKDTATSKCVDACAAAWPPVLAQPESKPPEGWSIVPRADGSQQWAFRGKPIYRYAKDGENGVPKGDGLGGVWRLAPSFPAE
jgi:predicted lipoprotein with Yx(FWY)xxD motif